jgi:hypothetical protein
VNLAMREQFSGDDNSFKVPKYEVAFVYSHQNLYLSLDRTLHNTQPPSSHSVLYIIYEGSPARVNLTRRRRFSGDENSYGWSKVWNCL